LAAREQGWDDARTIANANETEMCRKRHAKQVQLGGDDWASEMDSDRQGG
jgi:hypothetical protein